MDLKTKGAIQIIATEKIKNGWKQNRIAVHIQNKFPQVPIHIIQNVCRSAKNNVDTAHSLDKDFTIGLHLERYNEIIQDALSILEQFGDIDNEDEAFIQEFDYKMFAMTFENCLKTLQQKERLIGFHSKKFRIIINNIYRKVEVSKNNEVNFSIDKLSFEEQIELSVLLQKAKTKNE